MSVELDHVFVCCAHGAPEAALLTQRGLLEGSANTHPGQGTANRRFFFSNAYLELLWVSDPAEAQSENVLQTQLWERWSRRGEGACPFGIVFRPRTDSTGEAPFPCRSYRPPYLPNGLSIEIGRGMPITEPQLFYLPFARQRDPSGREPTTHPAGIDRITRVTVTIPAGKSRPNPSRGSSTPVCSRFGEHKNSCSSLTSKAKDVPRSISARDCRCCSVRVARRPKVDHRPRSPIRLARRDPSQKPPSGRVSG